MAGLVGCTECGVSFKNEAQRNRHSLKHGPTRYQCPQCCRLFIRRDVYSRHFKKQHSSLSLPGQVLILPSPVHVTIQTDQAPTLKRIHDVETLYKPPTEQDPQYSPNSNWKVPRTSDLPVIPRSVTPQTVAAPPSTRSANAIAELSHFQTVDLDEYAFYRIKSDTVTPDAENIEPAAMLSSSTDAVCARNTLLPLFQEPNSPCKLPLSPDNTPLVKLQVLTRTL